MEIGKALEDNAYTENPYVVIGYAKNVQAPEEGKTTERFYMVDDPDDKTEFYAYRASADAKVNNDDYIQLFGKIQKFVGSKGTTIELSYGTAKHLEAPKLDTLTVAQVLAMDLADNTETPNRYVVIAYVVEAEEFEEDMQEFKVSDDAAATVGKLQCIDTYIAEPGAKVNDQVKLVGKIQKMNGVFRMVNARAYVLGGEGIENIVLTEKAQKIMMDGVIYIIRDNKIYNLQGTQVR